MKLLTFQGGVSHRKLPEAILKRIDVRFVFKIGSLLWDVSQNEQPWRCRQENDWVSCLRPDNCRFGIRLVWIGVGNNSSEFISEFVILLIAHQRSCRLLRSQRAHQRRDWKFTMRESRAWSLWIVMCGPARSIQRSTSSMRRQGNRFFSLHWINPMLCSRLKLYVFFLEVSILTVMSFWCRTTVEMDNLCIAEQSTGKFYKSIARISALRQDLICDVFTTIARCSRCSLWKKHFG